MKNSKEICKKDDWKIFGKYNVKFALNILRAKYILLMFQNIIQVVKNKLFF